jgi:hypothetical protein
MLNSADRQKQGTLAGAMDERAGEPKAGMALAMLNAFSSVGANAFDLTLLDLEGRERGFQRNRSFTELRGFIGRRLAAAAELRYSLVIRPRSTTALLVQLDDFTAERAAQLAPHAFMTVCTSPNNFQVWLAVADGPKEKAAAKEFRTRVRRGAGADQSATGAVRLAGSLNFKTKYAPEFPLVALTWAKPGSLTTVAALEQAGWLAAPPLPPASVPRAEPAARAARGRYWPDYQQALRGAPLKGAARP